MYTVQSLIQHRHHWFIFLSYSCMIYQQLFQLQSSTADHPLSSQLIHQFQGGSTFRLLSRSKLFQKPGAEDKILAAFGDEATKSVRLINWISVQRQFVVQCRVVVLFMVLTTTVATVIIFIWQVHLWDVSKGVKVQQLPMLSSAALDLLPFSSHSNQNLAVLTENKLFTCNWQWK